MTYYPAVFKTYKFVLWTLVFIQLVIVRVNIELFDTKAWYIAVFSLIAMSTVPLSCLARLFWVIRPRIYSKYEILDDKIIVSFKKKVREVEFSQVERIKISFLPQRFFGGFRLHLKSGEDFFFLSLLKGSEEVFKRVTAHSDSLLSASRVESYLRESQLLPISWSRIIKELRNWKLLLVKYLAYPALVAAVFINSTEFFVSLEVKERFLAFFVLVFSFNILLNLVLGVLKEKILNKSIQFSDSGEVQVNQKFEDNYFICNQVLFFAISLGFYIYLL